jgi:hypothetical protein
MKYLKIFEDFSINEDRKHNEYLESLPVWKAFIHKFQKIRDDIRRKKNINLYKEEDKVAEQLPFAKFLDEWNLESIHYDWKSGYMKPVPWGSERDKAENLKFDGLKNPEIGDILIQFRGACWLFKPDASFRYNYSSSAVWGHDSNPNMWDDILYLDMMLKSYTFEFKKDEIPVIFREKLARKIRRNIFDKDVEYKRRKPIEQPYTIGGRMPGYTFK